MNKIKKDITISVIIPISERHDDLKKLYGEYSSQLQGIGVSFEFLFVVNEKFSKAIESIRELKKGDEHISLTVLSDSFGESALLSIGLQRSSGDYIFTLSAYFQVDTEGIVKIWNELSNGYDMVSARRYPRIDPAFNRLQSYVFHWLTWKMTGVQFHDISCGLKGMKRNVMEEIKLYGDLHRFMPILANKFGFKTKEVKIGQRLENTSTRYAGIGSYPSRLLDILTIFFLTKFTMKPLRFFGLIGITIFSAGTLITTFLGVYRLFGFGSIANRPMLLLGVLLMALGVQSLSIGLLGEIIIFTHARELKEYRVEEFLSSE